MRCPHCHKSIKHESGDLCEVAGCNAALKEHFFHALCLVQHYRAHWIEELDLDNAEVIEALREEVRVALRGLEGGCE